MPPKLNKRIQEGEEETPEKERRIDPVTREEMLEPIAGPVVSEELPPIVPSEPEDIVNEIPAFEKKPDTPVDAARKKGITHEYLGGNHRLIVDGEVGQWANFAAPAINGDYVAYSDDSGERVHKLNYLLDYNIIRDGKLR